MNFTSDFRSQRARSTFSDIYERDDWQGGSGVGSDPENTGAYRQLLSLLLSARDIAHVVDIGCGDWRFARMVDWSSVSYLGIDVVPELVEANRRCYGGGSISFTQCDVLHDPLPAGDLLIAKDVLQHWPNRDIVRFLRRARGCYRYMLLTNDVASWHCPASHLNADVGLGGWRTLDLEAPPFRLRPLWRGDYLVAHGEWRKRVLLAGQRRHLIRPGGASLRLWRYGTRVLASGPGSPP